MKQLSSWRAGIVLLAPVLVLVATSFLSVGTGEGQVSGPAGDIVIAIGVSQTGLRIPSEPRPLVTVSVNVTRPPPGDTVVAV